MAFLLNWNSVARYYINSGNQSLAILKNVNKQLIKKFNNHREGKNTKKSKRHKKQADFNEIELHTNN